MQNGTALHLLVASVIKHLENGAFDKNLGKIGRNVIDGWHDATKELTWAKVGHGLEVRR